MPPLPVVPNVVKIAHKHLVGDDLTATVNLHMHYTGTPPSNATCVTIAAALRASALTNFAPVMDTATDLSEITVTDLSSSTGGQGSDSVAVVGTRAGAFLPAATCVMMNHHIEERYRGGKPRAYWPWGCQPDLLNRSRWNPTFMADFLTAFGAYVTTLAGISVSGTIFDTLCAVSYYHGFTPVAYPPSGRYKNVPTKRLTPLVYTIDGFTVNPKPGQQRRRAKA